VAYRHPALASSHTPATIARVNFRKVLAVCLAAIVSSTAAADTFLHIDLAARPNMQLTEGAFMRDENGDPLGERIVLDADGYFTAEASEGFLIDAARVRRDINPLGEFLLAAAKDGTFALHSTYSAGTDDLTAPVAVELLVNSRERWGYDLVTDTFYYGSKPINFPRDSPRTITFQFGGFVEYRPAGDFTVVSASGVRTDVLPVPEPTTVAFLAAGSCLLFWRCGRACRR
jgi:hypothetical protein